MLASKFLLFGDVYFQGSVTENILCSGGNDCTQLVDEIIGHDSYSYSYAEDQQLH